MSVHIYATDRQTGRHHLIHEFGAEARGAQQLGGDLLVLPGDRHGSVLTVPASTWDLALITDGHGHTHIEVPRLSTQPDHAMRASAEVPDQASTYDAQTAI